MKPTDRTENATHRQRLFAVAACTISGVVVACACVATAAAPAYRAAQTLQKLPTVARATTGSTTRIAPATTPTIEPTTTVTAAPPVQRPPAASPDPADAPIASLFRAEAAVRAMHYTPVANDWYSDSVPGPLLEAIAAVPVGTAIGNQGHRVFFFVAGNFVGTDTTDGSANLEFDYSTGTIVAVNYNLYHPSDPLCCPNAGAQTVRFLWAGGRLNVLDPIPAPDPNVDPTRN